MCPVDLRKLFELFQAYAARICINRIANIFPMGIKDTSCQRKGFANSKKWNLVFDRARLVEVLYGNKTPE